MNKNNDRSFTLKTEESNGRKNADMGAVFFPCTHCNEGAGSDVTSDRKKQKQNET